jgi:anaerobic selenocysteine-containing dehydrogenase
MLWHIFENRWENKQFIHQRVSGIDDIRKEVAKWPPDEVERVTGLPETQVKNAERRSHAAPSLNSLNMSRFRKLDVYRAERACCRRTLFGA